MHSCRHGLKFASTAEIPRMWAVSSHMSKTCLSGRAVPVLPAVFKAAEQRGGCIYNGFNQSLRKSHFIGSYALHRHGHLDEPAL